MALRSDRCICLRKFQYSETSQILTLLGRSTGMFRVIAKGAHRRTKAGASRFDGGVDLLDLGEAVMTDPTAKELATLTEWKLLDGHLELRRDLRSLNLALYSIEQTGLLLHENEPQPAIFDLILWLIREATTDRREEAFVAFQLELLRISGFLPDLSSCASCGRPLWNGRVIFSPQAGGIICESCKPPAGPRLTTDARLVRILQTILKLPRAQGIPQRLPRLTRLQTDPVNSLLADYLRHITGHDLRVAQYVI
jgi:DNA repair protein RecO (recombination protein O)